MRPIVREGKKAFNALFFFFFLFVYWCNKVALNGSLLSNVVILIIKPNRKQIYTGAFVLRDVEFPLTVEFSIQLFIHG